MRRRAGGGSDALGGAPPPTRVAELCQTFAGHSATCGACAGRPAIRRRIWTSPIPDAYGAALALWCGLAVLRGGRAKGADMTNRESKGVRGRGKRQLGSILTAGVLLTGLAAPSAAHAEKKP